MEIYGGDNMKCPQMEIYGGEKSKMPIDGNLWW